MQRFTVWEQGQAPLPPLDLDGEVVIGSGPDARVRLPAGAIGDKRVRVARDEAVGRRLEYELGNYRVRVEDAPPGAIATPPQRTESLARELVRGLLAGAAPSLEIVRGPHTDARRELPPPEATVIIGRGDEATWVILDEDLSRQHAEIKRGWDGVTIRDLDSKNGTQVGGVRITGEVTLSDGARIELGNCELVFRDPAERHLQGEVRPATRTPVPPPAPPPPIRAASRIPFSIAVTIAGLAAAALVWVLAS